LLALGGAWAAQAVQHDLATPRDLHGTAHAGAAACTRCHPDHAQSFGRTFHRTMTQRASEQSVRGPFDGQPLDYFGVRARPSRGPQGEFLIEYAGPDVPATTFVVDKTVGSRRYQQYLAARDGALVRLPVAYHIEERRWFHMNGAFLTPDPEPAPALARSDYERHVTRWNDNCVFCHNVAPNPGMRAGPDGTARFETEVAELGVACEACHGPGLAHARANGNPLRRYALHLSGARDPSIVNPARLSPERALDVCGRCHGQRITDDVEAFLRRGDPFVPGDDLALFSAPLWRDTTLRGEPAFEPRFWADGTPRLTAYEYQGVLQSPCAQRGPLGCLSCHGMHEGDPRGQLRPDKLGAAQCTQCHAELAGTGAQRAHARHPAPGALPECSDCHMPRVVYGVLDVHPSHRIELPDPARDAAAQRPDACTLCHVERTRAWAIRQRDKLWPRAGAAHAPATPPESAAWSEVETQLFAGDPVERALAAHALRRVPAGKDRRQAALLLEVMLQDPYPAVRHLAWRSLRARERDPNALLHDYTPESSPSARAHSLSAARARFMLSAADAEHAAALRARAQTLAIDIGE
jgi:Doubled CXXCH motif (Paired_CXXCH_1)/Cytochrome c554 and c-prime